MSIANYNSDIDVLNQELIKTNHKLNELGDKNNILNMKKYEDINAEVSILLYREKIIFGVSALIAVSIGITTFKMI